METIVCMANVGTKLNPIRLTTKAALLKGLTPVRFRSNLKGKYTFTVTGKGRVACERLRRWIYSKNG